MILLTVPYGNRKTSYNNNVFSFNDSMYKFYCSCVDSGLKNFFYCDINQLYINSCYRKDIHLSLNDKDILVKYLHDVISYIQSHMNVFTYDIRNNLIHVDTSVNFQRRRAMITLI